MILIPGYRIRDKVHEDAQSIVYRGEREKDGTSVIIKTAAAEYPTLRTLAQLRHEYEITKALNIDGIFKPNAIVKYGNGLALMFRDGGEQSLMGVLSSGKMCLEEFLMMAISLAGILGDLHQNNVIHKDINPRHILMGAGKNEVQLTGFGIASSFPCEEPNITGAHIIQGALPYVSPEQTGRMNRSLDYRTDFYSLGVTFYEVLTGELPFRASDPLELVHCHMAREPGSPHQLDPEIPKVVSHLVMKLISKSAEDRYQGALGLKGDLNECLRRLETGDSITPFPIGRYDIPRTLKISHKLYGREGEVERLLRAFQQIGKGRTSAVMVAGYGGVGKTSLVREVHKLIAPEVGYFISGKFDQFQRNIPYNALVQAFQGLVKQILSEPQSELGRLKGGLLHALGPNGQIIIDVIPEVEHVIGPQPPVQELDPPEFKNLFNLVFQNFIQVFCRARHPLVIFLDDLQWADGATLNLIHAIMRNEKNQYLLLMGAYRHNEVDLDHPLASALKALREEKILTDEITLGSLGLDHLTQLMADALLRDVESVAPLAALVERKTGGNPFFLEQFLRLMHEKGLFQFDVDLGGWHWKMEGIREAAMTDNVIDLMAEKIRELPGETREVLKLAACIGSPFDLETLTIVHEAPAHKTAHDLRKAVQEGLILPVSDAGFPIPRSKGAFSVSDPESQASNPKFRFLHDRVQQAAHLLIREKRKKEVALKIGRLMLKGFHGSEIHENVFDILNHMNVAKDLITTRAEKDGLAKLNLMGGMKAKTSAAYGSALEYLVAGMGLMEENCWRNQYDLTFNLHRECAELEYLTGNFEQAEKLIDLTLAHARFPVEKADLYSLLIVQYSMTARFGAAYGVGRKALRILGMELPEIEQVDIGEILDEQLARVKETMGNRMISSLINGPELAVPEKKMAVRLLTNMLPLSYFLDLKLFGLLTAKLVCVLLQYGHVPVSSYVFACYGRLLISRGEYASGYEFGLLGMRLSERYNDLAQKCRCYNTFANYVHPWGKHMREADSFNKEGYRAGLQSGEFQFAGYCLCNTLFNLFYQGIHLETILTLCLKYRQFVRKTRNRMAEGVIDTVHWVLVNLIGRGEGDFDVFREKLKEKVPFRKSLQSKDLVLVSCHYQVYRAEIQYLCGNPDHALESILEARTWLAHVVGSVLYAKHNFVYSLILADLYPGASEERKRQYLRRIEANQEQLKVWADNCEANFLHKYLLVAGELGRITGKNQEAKACYHEAGRLAKQNEYVQDEALANELAAKFFLGGKEKGLAAPYLKKAHYGYGIWGAMRKVENLEMAHHHFFMKKTVDGNRCMVDSTHSEGLDLSTMMKASRAISGEIVLDRLLAKLTKILIENAGAQKGFFILESHGRLLIEAEGDIDRAEVRILQSVSVEKSENISPAIIQYVARTREYVVLNDAGREGMFKSDPHVQSRHVKSVVCGPILHKSRLIGMFYLENALISGAFTPDRLEVLKLLASQIAISMENAMLYSNLESQARKTKAANAKLEREIREKKRAEEKYRGIFENAVEGIFQAGPRGLFVNANPALARILGFESPDELILKINDMGHPLYVDPVQREKLLQLMRNRKTISGHEVQLRRKDGSSIWASLHARPVFDENDQLLLIEGILTDISRRKAEAEALREREESLRRENIRLRSDIGDRYKFGNIVGKSPGMQRVYGLVLKAAANDANIIIYGESGTGKELVAKAIHRLSGRKGKKFVSVNCGAIPENLLESEFFGYKKGAFTGAYAAKEGFFDLAHGGTLFLDELGEINLNLQVKLLRAIEGGGYTPVGGNEVKRPDFRLIAATHRDLQEQVKQGLMREDFFYRIHIIPILIPPLRDRKEDLSLLVEHFLKEYGKDGDVPNLSGNDMEAMLDHDWPGNVRELQNTLQRYIMLGHLDFMGAPSRKQDKINPVSEEETGMDGHDLRRAVENFEKGHIVKVLNRNRWQRGKVASLLKIDRKTLFKKMKNHGLMDPGKGSMNP